MRPLSAFAIAALAASAASRAIHGPFHLATVTSLLPTVQLRDLQINKTDTANVSIAAEPDDEWTLDPDSEPEDEWNNDEPWSFDPVDGDAPEEDGTWCKAKSRGAKLIKAMMMNDQEAVTMLAWPYLQSPWDGDLRSDLRKWGYLDDDRKHSEADIHCDFSQDLGAAFADLHIDPRSSGRGGPNQCFFLEHMNGPTVIRDEKGQLPFEEDQYYEADGKKYRVTQAYAKIGVNAQDGLVYFVHRHSPESAAEEYWGHPPDKDELPALRSSSDLAWGMWNRAAAGNLRNLNYFMSREVVNSESKYIMSRALEQYGIDEDPPVWPGTDFQFALEEGKELEMEAALALLGSPNGMGAGYFLIQHRRQLGWKYIWKVKIWSAAHGTWALPNMLFYVSDHATFVGPEPQRRLDEQLKDLHIAQRRKRDLAKASEPGVVYRSEDGRNMIREHVIMAKL